MLDTSQRSMPPRPSFPPEDLFSRVGLELVSMVDPGPGTHTVRTRHFPARGFSLDVYENLTFMERQTPSHGTQDGGRQLFLPLSVASQAVTLVIPPTSIAFMNASIRSIFRSTRKLQNAATHLMRADILYLGDLTLLSSPEFRARLGGYRELQSEMEAELQRLGLTLGAVAPWWRRPRDYYQHNL